MNHQKLLLFCSLFFVLLCSVVFMIQSKWLKHDRRRFLPQTLMNISIFKESLFAGTEANFKLGQTQKVTIRFLISDTADKYVRGGAKTRKLENCGKLENHQTASNSGDVSS